MKRKSLVLIIICLTLCLCSCSKSRSQSSFTIQFIDVGQGDSALVECDGHYMLIDGGDITAGDIVYNVLEENQVQRLDILAISHLHQDHIGGLPKALTYSSKINLTISNSDYSNSDVFRKLENQLGTNESKITIPRIGDKYKLGSADVEVIEVSSEEENDSLVLLVTYGKTKYLFTGDIGANAQTRISNKYENESDKTYDIDLIKMPHHGSYTGSLYRFIRTFMPEYVVISAGTGNKYGHPQKETLDLLNGKTYNPTVFRTDRDGNIIVKSDGKSISVETSK